MDVNETAPPEQIGSADLGPEPEPYSAEWWQGRTAAELRDIIKRGFGTGQAFDGAVVESERRAREATRRLRDQVETADRRRGRIRLLGLGAILVILVAIFVYAWLAFSPRFA